jgi:hypothetical protein
VLQRPASSVAGGLLRFGLGRFVWLGRFRGYRGFILGGSSLNWRLFGWDCGLASLCSRLLAVLVVRSLLGLSSLARLFFAAADRRRAFERRL